MVISLTRLRLASSRFLPGFVWFSVGSIRQARAAPGFRGMRLLADRRLTFWTMTAWDNEASMKAYRGSGAHRAAMRYLSGWCDEASVARWSGPAETMGDWAAAYRRMSADGTASHVKRPSAGQTAKTWPPPRVSAPFQLVIKSRGSTMG